VNLLTILIVAFAALVGLVFMTIVATILAAGVFYLLPQLEQTWAAVSLWVLALHAARVAARALKRTPDDPEPQFAVSVCIHPLGNPEYLVGFVPCDRGTHRIAWSNDKAHARVIEDKLALKAWIWTLEEGHFDVFVCVPPSK